MDAKRQPLDDCRPQLDGRQRVGALCPSHCNDHILSAATLPLHRDGRITSDMP
jgi:hypothetical protein